MVDVKNKYIFFFVVLFFAGSVVLMSVRDLRRHMKVARTQTVDMKEIVTALQGDVLQQYAFDAGRFKQGDRIPAREPGQILANEDKKWFKSIIHKVLSKSEEN